MNVRVHKGVPKLFGGMLWLLMTWIAVPVQAAELVNLAWGTGPAGPVLVIKVKGESAYSTETLESGQRLRLVFPGSSLGAAVTELGPQGSIKGVYPYLADNGKSVHVDILSAEPAQLDVQLDADGYRVAISGAAATPALAEAPVEKPAPAPAAASAPAAAPAPAPVSAPVKEPAKETTKAAAAPAPKPVPAPAPAKAQPEPEPAPAPATARAMVNDIVYAKLPGDRIQITLKMSQPVPEPKAFSISNPARLSLDFPNTGLALAKKSVPVKEGAVLNVTAVEAENRTRVVVSLVKSVAYSAVAEGNNYVITLAAPTTQVATAEAAKTTRFASTRKAGKYNVTGIDFRRGPQGDGKIIVSLSDPTVGIDIREQAGEIVLDFLNTSVATELQRRLDVIDFATPVQTIDTYIQGKNTRMVVTPKGKYEHVAYQTGNVFTVSVKPIIERPGEKKVDEFGYSGEKLSLNFQNIDVRAALQVLADFTGLNFVISDTVKGNLTLRLKDVPWDQALDLIIDSKGLAVRRKGNVISIAPAAEVAAKEKSANEAAKSALELEPLNSELIRISYAKAEDVAALLKSIKPVTTGAGQHPVFGASATGGTLQASTESNTLLSPRGQVTVDVRTNSLLVQDTPAKLREIRVLIAQLDQPVRQVMVETRLVEATEGYSKTLGVRLGTVFDDVHKGRRQLGTGRAETLDKTYFEEGTFDINDHWNVNLPSAGIGSFAPGAATWMLRKGNQILDLELTALEQSGNGKIVSSPRVITADQKKAVIEQGQERVFTTSVLGVGTVVTKKATLKLEVTPQITPDDRVNLNVNVTKDNFSDATSGLLNVKQITTQVLLENGDTVVIGGIYEQDKSDTVTKIPFLGDLPLVGWLFRNKDSKDNKTELLIFLTPRILSERVAVR